MLFDRELPGRVLQHAGNVGQRAARPIVSALYGFRTMIIQGENVQLLISPKQRDRFTHTLPALHLTTCGM